MAKRELLEVAMQAGEIILKSGGETYRVEETINKIGKAVGFHDIDSFVTPTGIIVTAHDATDNLYTMSKRIHNRTVNLERVAQVNEISRQFVAGKINVAEGQTQLQALENSPTYSYHLKLLGAGLAGGSSVLLFRGILSDAFVAFFITIMQQWLLHRGKFTDSPFLFSGIGGVITALLALLSVYAGVGSSLDLIIIGSIMPLVPGIAITNAVRDSLAGDLISGIARGAEAILIATSIAAGIGIILRLSLLRGGF